MQRLSPATASPILLLNIITSAVVFADKIVLRLSGKCKLLEKFRDLLVACFLFFLHLLSSVFPIPKPNSRCNPSKDFKFFATEHQIDDLASGGGGDSSIARAIWRLLSAMNDIPVSSRKYEVVRSLAERLIDENHRENSAALFHLNRGVLTASFSMTLGRLESAVERKRRDTDEMVRYGLNRLANAAIRAVGDGLWGHAIGCGETVDQPAEAAEKLAAELQWLAEKMASCGFAEEAIEKWASASRLARFAVWAEPPVQGSVVKVTAFLLKQFKNMGKEEAEKDGQRQTKKKMLILWLPLLCRASNGTDKPILRPCERAEIEEVLEDMIEELKQEEQEQVLSVWLHNFTYCSSSDWPNLLASYARWCGASRQQLLLHCQPASM